MYLIHFNARKNLKSNFGDILRHFLKMATDFPITVFFNIAQKVLPPQKNNQVQWILLLKGNILTTFLFLYL